MPASVDREFFEIAAQVIPVLLLAGLVEYRGEPSPVDPDAPRHRLGGPERALALQRLFMVAALVWAEVAAFVAIAGRPTMLERHFVVVGLGIGGLLLVDRVVTHELDRLVPTMRRRGYVATTVVFCVVLVGVIVAAMFGSVF